MMIRDDNEACQTARSWLEKTAMRFRRSVLFKKREKREREREGGKTGGGKRLILKEHPSS